MQTRLLPVAVLALVACTIALAAGAAPENLIFVLDASNSMNKPFGEETRFSAAKSALAELFEGIPEGGNAGLLVYGHRINHNNEVESCQDIDLLFPLAPYTAAARDEMISVLPGIQAQGKTPLADSLVFAANQLEEGGTIILVSDGEGNCGGQHMVVAQMLATMDPPIVLHVVGIDVEEEAGETLRAIALETSGSYWSVSEASGLLAALFAAVGPTETVPEISPSGIPAEYACLGITNVIHGTEDDDTLYGTDQNDLILGYGGDDFLVGLDGDDVLVGGDGVDILEGGTGRDILFGDGDADLLFGGAQNDILCGGPGNDSLEGEAGDDALDGGDGRDVLLGGVGNDTLYCADMADVLLEGGAVSGSCESCLPRCGVAPIEPVCIPVEPPCSPPPCPVATDTKTLNEGESIQLHGTVADSDCNIAQVFWQVSAGTLDDPTSLDPVYTAPMIDGCDAIEVCVTLTALDNCGASASDSFILTVNNVNCAPSVDAGRALCIDEESSVVLQPAAFDPDGDPLSYCWTVTTGGGDFEDPTTLDAVFHAPMIDDCEGTLVTLTLSVTDPCGLTACDSVVVHVQNVNRAPIVDLGPDFALDEGTSLRLTPVVSDPECEDLAYCWTVTGGGLDRADGECPTFTAPLTNCCDGVQVEIQLTVIDPCGLAATDTVCVFVGNVNGSPTVDLGPDLTITEGESICLAASAFDPDCDALRYSWTVTEGLVSDPSASAPAYTAPLIDVCEGIDVVITLTVTDPCGLTATGALRVHVANVNRPPTVHADP